MSYPLLTDLGPDTVELVVRTPTLDVDGHPVLDVWGRPELTETTVAKQRCSVQIVDGTEEVADNVIAVLRLRALLPVDGDTEALQPSDAVRFRGRLYELSMPGVRHDTLSGDPSHVRIAGQWAADAGIGEQVIVIPYGGKDDAGNALPDGAPFPLIARAVVPGSVLERFGAASTLVGGGFTVVLAVDAPVRDGDWMVVRGHDCRVIVGRQESQWSDRRELVVTAQYRAGGRG